MKLDIYSHYPFKDMMKRKVLAACVISFFLFGSMYVTALDSGKHCRCGLYCQVASRRE